MIVHAFLESILPRCVSSADADFWEAVSQIFSDAFFPNVIPAMD